jgi:hypothetical protein
MPVNSGVQRPGVGPMQPPSPTQAASAQPTITPAAPPPTVQTVDTSNVPGKFLDPHTYLHLYIYVLHFISATVQTRVRFRLVHIFLLIKKKNVLHFIYSNKGYQDLMYLGFQQFH